MSEPSLPSPPRGGWRTITILILSALVVLMGAFYLPALPGLSVATNEPSKVEVSLATWMLKHSVAAKSAAQTNPLNVHADAADIRAGKDLFITKCSGCHAYDGGGKTEIGAGTFPRPPVLRVAVQSLS